MTTQKSNRRDAEYCVSKLNQIQAIQDQIYDLYRLDSPDNQAAVDAGLLAWEAVRLFWYAAAGDEVGISEKAGYVKEALARFERKHLSLEAGDD